MHPVIVIFPPGAGGNHLRNMLDASIARETLTEIYKNHRPMAHAKIGNNFKVDNLINKKIAHGHFAEIMSQQVLLRSMSDTVKLIILSINTADDRNQLKARRSRLNHNVSYQVGDYFDGEQVFLYESFMYHYYFNIPMSNIMNISISDWFKADITQELERISEFLQIDLDKKFCLDLHAMWYEKNLKGQQNE